jgi:hypothetical protein
MAAAKTCQEGPVLLHNRRRRALSFAYKGRRWDYCEFSMMFLEREGQAHVRRNAERNFVAPCGQVFEHADWAIAHVVDGPMSREAYNRG